MIKRNDFYRQEFIHLAVLLTIAAALYAPVVRTSSNAFIPFNVLPAGSSILLPDKDAGDADSPSKTIS